MITSQKARIIEDVLREAPDGPARRLVPMLLARPPAEDLSAFSAKALAISAERAFAALDAGIMLQTLFLSAKAHGVDSCPLGVLATWRRPFDAEFEAPADYRLITGFALGYASDAPVNDFRAERRPVRLVPSRS